MLLFLNLLAACEPHFPINSSTIVSCSDTATFTDSSVMVVGGVTSYDGNPLSHVTIGLLDSLPNDTWGTDDPMVVVDETISNSSGNYAVSAHEHSSYWLLGANSDEDHFGQLASVQHFDLMEDGQTEFAWIDLSSITQYDSADETADTSCIYNWEQLSYSCATANTATGTITECSWQWGNC